MANDSKLLVRDSLLLACCLSSIVITHYQKPFKWYRTSFQLSHTPITTHQSPIYLSPPSVFQLLLQISELNDSSHDQDHARKKYSAYWLSALCAATVCEWLKIRADRWISRVSSWTASQTQFQAYICSVTMGPDRNASKRKEDIYLFEFQFTKYFHGICEKCLQCVIQWFQRIVGHMNGWTLDMPERSRYRTKVNDGPE